MELQSLPTAIYVVATAKGGDTFSAKGTKDARSGWSGLFVWTSRERAAAYVATQTDGASILEIDRDFHFWKWIDEIPLGFCIIDRPVHNEYLELDEIDVAELPESHFLNLTDRSAQLDVVVSALRRQGAEDVVLEFVRKVGLDQPQIPVGQLTTKVQELVEEHTRTQREAEEALAQLPTEMRKAFLELLPREACVKCGERDWALLDVSRSQTAAKWQCNFCGKRCVVREDSQCPDQTAPSREAIPKGVQREVWQRDRGRCVVCGSQEKLEYDHIIPVSRGGANTVRNIQLLCEPCNRQKSNHIG